MKVLRSCVALGVSIVLCASFAASASTIQVSGTDHLDIVGGDNYFGGSPSVDAIDSSSVFMSGGTVDFLRALNTSSFTMVGGTVDNVWLGTSVAIGVTHAATGLIAGGTVTTVQTMQESTLSVTGGTIGTIVSRNDSSVNVNGGAVAALNNFAGNSTITLEGVEVSLDSGLEWDGGSAPAAGETGRILGTGFLTGTWADGTTWTTEITNNSGGGIFFHVIPLPAPVFMVLFGLVGVAVVHRRHFSGTA